MLSSAPGVNGGVSRTMRVITFLRVDFRVVQIISSLEPVVVSRGAGNVVRSFVLLTSIPKRGKRILKVKNPIMRSAVKRRTDSNRTTIVLAVIIVIVRNGGLVRKRNRLWNI
jgi:hypothetical protein